MKLDDVEDAKSSIVLFRGRPGVVGGGRRGLLKMR